MIDRTMQLRFLFVPPCQSLLSSALDSKIQSAARAAHSIFQLGQSRIGQVLRWPEAIIYLVSAYLSRWVSQPVSSHQERCVLANPSLFSGLPFRIASRSLRSLPAEFSLPFTQAFCPLPPVLCFLFRCHFFDFLQDLLSATMHHLYTIEIFLVHGRLSLSRRAPRRGSLIRALETLMLTNR